MHTFRFVLSRVLCHAIPIALLGFTVTNIAYGQTTAVVSTIQPVGGVSINTDGVLSLARTEDLDTLSKLRQQSLEKIPAELNPAVEMRKISLRRLEAQIAKLVAIDRVS